MGKTYPASNEESVHYFSDSRETDRKNQQTENNDGSNEPGFHEATPDHAWTSSQ